MHIHIPQTIASATVAVLHPYCPELTPEKLIEALTNREPANAKPTRSKPLTRRQVAEILQISLASVNRRIKDGTLRSFKISPRLVRIDPTSVEALIQAERETTAAVTEA